MNIFAKFSLRSLLKNRTRTVVTIIGITLSVAMFTAVTEAVESIRSYIVNIEVFSNGSYDAMTSSVESKDFIEKILNDKNVTESESLSELGFAEIESNNAAKPYLCVMGMSEGFEDMVTVRLTSGRMPQNENELILPSNLVEFSDADAYNVGDTLNLNIGSRKSGDTLHMGVAYEEDEQLLPGYDKTYTVVGFYDRFSYDIDNYSNAGYVALTKGGSSGFAKLFFKARDYKKLEQTDGVTVHYMLLRYKGFFQNEVFTGVYLGLAAVLCGIIMFGSIALIYNSFSISVGERQRQFGLLKSVGATRRQIRRTVLWEALFLCIVGVPLGLVCGCGGLAVALWALRDSTSILSSGFGSLGLEGAPQFIFSFSPASVAAAAIIGVVMTVISAWLPARRAVKIPVIDALRSSRDITAKRSRSRIAQRLFGFEGMIASKNFKRNKKRFRAAIASLFMSVVLFISASSFCSYLTAAASFGEVTNYDISYQRYCNADASAAADARNESKQIFTRLSSCRGVTESALTRVCYADIYTEREYLTDDFYEKEVSYRENESIDASSVLTYFNVYYIDDELYLDIARKSGIDASLSDPGILVRDVTTTNVSTGDGYRMERYNTFERKDDIPLCITASREDSEVVDVDFEKQAVYYAPYHSKAVKNDDGSESHIREIEFENRFAVPLSEAAIPLKIAGFIENSDVIPFFCSDSVPLCLLPESAQTELSESLSGYYNACFKSSDPMSTFDEMERLAEPFPNWYGQNYAESEAQNRAIVMLVNVFAYGFIILISLIALANVFNTVSTNIILRRRELAMYKSIGMTKRGFSRMMNYECIICGVRSLLFGLPAAVIVTYLIYRVVGNGFDVNFYIPWYSIAIAAGSVFVVVFSAMLYSMRKIRKRNTIDTLREENI